MPFITSQNPFLVGLLLVSTPRQLLRVTKRQRSLGTGAWSLTTFRYPTSILSRFCESPSKKWNLGYLLKDRYEELNVVIDAIVWSDDLTTESQCMQEKTFAETHRCRQVDQRWRPEEPPSSVCVS